VVESILKKQGGRIGNRVSVALRLAWVSLLAGAPLLAGCAGGTAGFVHPNADFSRIRRCAILPFENLTADGYADERLGSVFLMEILRQGDLVALDVEESIEAMRNLKAVPGTNPTEQQVVALGQALGVDAVFFGTVEEYGQSGRSRQGAYFVTASFSLADAETGVLIWRSQVHVQGTSLRQRLFGGEPPSLYEVSVEAVRQALRTLF
jgi:hypothetical protein